MYQFKHYILSKPYISLHSDPKCLYTVTIEGQEQGLHRVPMRYGTIACNGVAHGYKIPKQKH